MNLTLNSTVLNRCNIVSFTPEDIKEDFTMADGGKSVDIINQKQHLSVSYDVIKSNDLAPILTIWKLKAAVTAAFTDTSGAAVSFSAYMIPPAYVPDKHRLRHWDRALKEGHRLIGQCSFMLDEL